MQFHERLRYWRKAAGLTQEQLAHRCGYSGQNRIANYESATEKNRREPAIGEIPQLADALGIRSGQLVDDREMEAASHLRSSSSREGKAGWGSDVVDLADAIDATLKAFASLRRSPNAIGLAAGIALASEIAHSGASKAVITAAVRERLLEIGEEVKDGSPTAGPRKHGRSKATR